jgi:hypothetical protein
MCNAAIVLPTLGPIVGDTDMRLLVPRCVLLVSVTNLIVLFYFMYCVDNFAVVCNFLVFFIEPSSV